MKRFYYFLLLLCAVFTLQGCSDDDPAPDIDNPVQDNFYGPYSSIILGMETEGLNANEIELLILAPDSSIICREARHTRSGDVSTIDLDHGLKKGIYRLLAARFPDKGNPAEFPVAEFGLGSRIEVASDGIRSIDPFNPSVGYAGKGTQDSPYIVSSASHLFNLMMTVNDYDSNRDIPAGTYFRQVCDIDMKQSSRSCDMEYGWLPIGANTNTPFRGIYIGDGHKITNLMINRPRSAGIGLFGFVCGASFDGVHMADCSVAGEFGVGILAGASIASGGDSRQSSTFSSCIIENCDVRGGSTSAALGCVLGATDMHTRTLLSDCIAEGGSVTGGMNAGGITGGAGMYSSVMITGCTNSTAVTAMYSGAGGMIGTADTLQLAGCRNTARIAGATEVKSASGNPGIGAGGMAGGSGFSWITGSVNSGEVSGYEGVGGIIGSTRVKGSASDGYIYNQTVLRYCINTASVSGQDFVGGTIGEAQAGTYGVGNSGAVKGKKYVGGICGNSSVAVIHNSTNTGNVEGEEYVAGIIGKTTWGSLAIDQNTGCITGYNGNTAGIMALAGNNTIVNYCANYGDVVGPSSHPVGGIAAEIGDPRKWTAMNIAECVIGSIECVMAVAGPVLAVAEEAIEFAEAVEIVVKVVETSVELCLQATDYALVSYAIHELVSPEAEAELSASMKAKVEDASQEVRDFLGTARMNCGGETANFPTSTTLSARYADNIRKICDYYETEGNDEKFNEAINETREKRAEKLEKASRMQEILHTAVAGVAVVTSTVALVAGTVASGGAATAFLLAGSTAALVGGANAIIKSCTEFEHNAVVVSQCLNAGRIDSPGNGKAATIIGNMEDGCAVYDCMNTASFSGSSNLFVGDYGLHCSMDRFISLVPYDSDRLYGLSKVVMCDPALKEGKTDFAGESGYVAPDRMSDPSCFKWFSIGDDDPWIIPEGGDFPVPNLSLMQK